MKIFRLYFFPPLYLPSDSNWVTIDRSDSNWVTIDRSDSNRVTIDRSDSNRVTIDRSDSNWVTIDRIWGQKRVKLEKKKQSYNNN